MLEVAVKLFAVTLVMAGGLVLAARAARGGRPGAGVRVTGRHGVTKSSTVAVVEVDGRRFLVGAGDGQVSLLAELDPAAAEVDEDPPTTAERPAGAGSRVTAARLGAALAAAHRHSRRPHRTGPSTTTGPRIGPLDRLRAMTVRTHVRDVASPGVEPPIHVEPPPS